MNDRIQCISEEGQVFVQEEWLSRGGSGLDETDLRELSGVIMETTKRETK